MSDLKKPQLKDYFEDKSDTSWLNTLGKGVDIAFAPFKQTGMGIHGIFSPTPFSEQELSLRELWATEVQEAINRLKSGEITKEEYADIARKLRDKYESMGAMPTEQELGKRQIEEYEELPWWEQMLYESPAYLVPGGSALKGFKSLSSPAKNIGWNVGKGLLPKGAEITADVASKAGQTLLAPLAGVEKATEIGIKGITKPGTALIKRLLEIPEKTFTNDYSQLKTIHKLAAEKGLKGTRYKNFLKMYTGKDSAAKLSREESDYVILAMEGLVKNSKGKVVIPKTKDIVERNFFLDEIPALKDIGLLDAVRQKTQVLRYKFGSFGRKFVDELLETELKYSYDRQLFQKTSDSMLKLIGNNPQSKVRIFDAIENPIQTHLLDENEREVFKWLKTFFDDWANRLNMAIPKRRKNYVTHLMDEQIEKELNEGRTLAMEMMAAFDYKPAKEVFMPFFQKRTGKVVGIKKDPFEAASVYEYYALKKTHYEPLIQKLSAYSKLLTLDKPVHAKYLDDISRRLAGRLSDSDLKFNKAFSSFADNLAKVPVIGKVIPKRLQELASKGNFAALVGYNLSSLYYMSWLGFRPVSAIRNLSQQLLAVCDVGGINFAKGLGLRATKEGKAALKESIVLQGRLMGKPVTGLEEDTLRKMPQKMQDWALGLFKWADRQNVTDSFLAGYAKGKQLGLPREWSIKLGDEVAMDTQYLYTRMARSLFEESVAGRFLTPFTSWPRNFSELMVKWVSGRPSLVLQEFERQTGKKVIKETNWFTRRKELWTYAALLSGAYMTEGLTDIKAAQYTGWTSVNNLGRLLGGDIPAWQIPRGLAYLLFGSASGDMTMIKQGWNEVRPDRFIQIVKQLENIAEGKTDVASLFFYIERAKADEEEKKSRGKSKGKPVFNP